MFHVEHLKGGEELEEKQTVNKDDIIRSRVSPVVKQRIKQIQEQTQQNESEVVRELLNLGLSYHYQIYKLGLK